MLQHLSDIQLILEKTWIAMGRGSLYKQHEHLLLK